MGADLPAQPLLVHEARGSSVRIIRVERLGEDHDALAGDVVLLQELAEDDL